MHTCERCGKNVHQIILSNGEWLCRWCAPMSETEQTFAQELEREAQGEPILGVVIGNCGWDGYRWTAPLPMVEEGYPLLTWEEARPHLDYTYDDGYGAPDCHSVFLWTETRVIFVSQYDGATRLETIPRDPVPSNPYMPGGGW